MDESSVAGQVPTVSFGPTATTRWGWPPGRTCCAAAGQRRVVGRLGDARARLACRSRGHRIVPGPSDNLRLAQGPARGFAGPPGWETARSTLRLSLPVLPRSSPYSPGGRRAGAARPKWGGGPCVQRQLRRSPLPECSPGQRQAAARAGPRGEPAITTRGLRSCARHFARPRRRRIWRHCRRPSGAAVFDRRGALLGAQADMPPARGRHCRWAAPSSCLPGCRTILPQPAPSQSVRLKLNGIRACRSPPCVLALQLQTRSPCCNLRYRRRYCQAGAMP